MSGELGGVAWEVARRAASPALSGLVAGSLQGYVERAPHPVERREFSGPRAVLIFELGPPLAVFDRAGGGAATRFARGFVGGLDDVFTATRHEGFQEGVQVDLTPLGARRVFGVPMSELTRRVVPFDALVGPRHRDLAERLAALPSWAARFDMVEAFLLERAGGTAPDAIIAHAVSAITRAGGLVDVRALCDHLGYSQRHVIARFRDQVGVPPKLFARLVRFDRLVRRVRGGPGAPWADLAAELGYCDQSHLARDVRAFMDVTPSELADLFVALDPLG